MNQRKREAIFARFAKANPAPTTELNFKSPFELLIAVMLSAQATDVSVNKATDKLFKAAKNPKSMLALGVEGLKPFIQTINFYPTKAKHIIKACEMLVNEFHSKVPSTRVELETLPGVGRKTANVVLNTAFGEEAMAVDTHIFRVANRTKLAPGKTPREVEDNLLKFVPPPYLKDAHHWLILHGRYTCTARKPKCPECLIQDLCEYPEKTVYSKDKVS